MERLKIELAQKIREFERHKEVVLSRDVALLTLEQEIRALKQQLNGGRHDFPR
jgi:hypothetical protein